MKIYPTQFRKESSYMYFYRGLQGPEFAGLARACWPAQKLSWSDPIWPEIKDKSSA